MSNNLGAACGPAVQRCGAGGAAPPLHLANTCAAYALAILDHVARSAASARRSQASPCLTSVVRHAALCGDRGAWFPRRPRSSHHDAGTRLGRGGYHRAALTAAPLTPELLRQLRAFSARTARSIWAAGLSSAISRSTSSRSTPRWLPSRAPCPRSPRAARSACTCSGCSSTSSWSWSGTARTAASAACPSRRPGAELVGPRHCLACARMCWGRRSPQPRSTTKGGGSEEAAGSLGESATQWTSLGASGAACND